MLGRDKQTQLSRRRGAGQRAAVGRQADLRDQREQIREIQSEITDVQEIFEDFHDIVQDQQGMVDSIHLNIKESHVKVEEGLGQIRIASEHSRRKRNALCYTLFFFFLVVLGIGVFMYEFS